MTKPPPRILLVDDEPTNLLFLEELLHSEGYETVVAASGGQALESAKTSQPDLILLDVMMPDMDGFEVCHQLREDITLQTVPVIFLTALDDDESRLRGLDMMGDDYITKPVKSSLLLKKIASILRLGQLRAEKSERVIHQQVREQTKNQISAALQINDDLSEKFRLFVPEQFLNRIAPEGVESIQLGNAQEEELTILFCDIRDFTAIAESQKASETMEWLNAFFSWMNQAIVTHHGFIDKFLGDAIMAVFDRTGEHPQDALSAAVMMLQSLNEFNAIRDQYKLVQSINVGIGIHTGMGIIGTVGSDRRMDPTVIGDVVNTAARVEELTKSYRCQIIASGSVIAQLRQPELFSCRLVDRVTPRGKQQVLDLYEVHSAQTHSVDPPKILH